MRIRSNPTYLSADVWKSCWLIAQAKGTQTDEQGLSRVTTADEMADNLLRELLKEKYPQLFEHQKTVEKLEKEVIKKIGA
jgi:hypothetical protein